MPGAGAMRERLVIQENAPDPIVVSSLTRASTTATATTSVAHGYATNDFVTIAGAAPAGYNGKFKVTVTGPTTFTYVVNGALVTPATGAITALYVSDAQGVPRIAWQTLDTIWAESLPVRAAERLQAQAVQAVLDYRFRVYVRPDITAKMRALWTPTWPPSSPQHTLEIHGVPRDDDGRFFMFLECGEIA